MNNDDFARLEKTAQELFLFKKQNNQKEYNRHRNNYAKEFYKLIEVRARPYNKFSNYKDLVQEGYIALMNAENSYKVEKGEFTYWADQYISLRIKRKAKLVSLIKLTSNGEKLLKKINNCKFNSLASLNTSDNYTRLSIGDFSSSAQEEILYLKEVEKILPLILENISEPTRTLLIETCHWDNISLPHPSVKTKTIDQVCADLNISVSTGKRLLKDGKNKLYKLIQKDS